MSEVISTRISPETKETLSSAAEEAGGLSRLFGLVAETYTLTAQARRINGETFPEWLMGLAQAAHNDPAPTLTQEAETKAAIAEAKAEAYERGARDAQKAAMRAAEIALAEADRDRAEARRLRREAEADRNKLAKERADLAAEADEWNAVRTQLAQDLYIRGASDLDAALQRQASYGIRSAPLTSAIEQAAVDVADRALRAIGEGQPPSVGFRTLVLVSAKALYLASEVENHPLDKAYSLSHGRRFIYFQEFPVVRRVSPRLVHPTLWGIANLLEALAKKADADPNLLQPGGGQEIFLQKAPRSLSAPDAATVEGHVVDETKEEDNRWSAVPLGTFARKHWKKAPR